MCAGKWMDYTKCRSQPTLHQTCNGNWWRLKILRPGGQPIKNSFYFWAILNVIWLFKHIVNTIQTIWSGLVGVGYGWEKKAQLKEELAEAKAAEAETDMVATEGIPRTRNVLYDHVDPGRKKHCIKLVYSLLVEMIYNDLTCWGENPVLIQLVGPFLFAIHGQTSHPWLVPRVWPLVTDIPVKSNAIQSAIALAKHSPEPPGQSFG